MKKISFKVAAFLLIGALGMNSCIGSFSLFNSYAKWQCHMSDNKFVNAVVGFVLMPIVGSITLLVDSLVLNTVEFWTGDNPMNAEIGKTKKVMGEDGQLYAVTVLKNGYEIKSEVGKTVLLTYDKSQDAWSMTSDGVTKELFRYTSDKKAIKAVLNGEEKVFTLNEQGVYDARMAAGEGLFFAAR